MELNLVGNFNNLLKSGIYLLFVGVMLIILGGVSAGGSYLIMDKFDGADRSWVETFSPSIAFFSLIAFVVAVTAFGMGVCENMSCPGAIVGVLVGGLVALLTVEPIVWLAEFLDEDRTDFAGFSWIIWTIGVLTTAAGAYWLLPCGGGFCSNDDDDNDDDTPAARKWYDNMTQVATGACLLAFVIRLEEKVEDGSEHSYVKVWIPYMVLCGWQVLGMILNFAIMVSNGSSTVTYAKKIYWNILTILSSIYVGITLPLYLDGKITEGWKVVLPAYISSCLYVLAGVGLIIVGTGIIMGSTMANGGVNIGNILHGHQNQPAQAAENQTAENQEFNGAIDALNGAAIA